MDTPRSVFKIDTNSPGSDVAAETAAALAAASLVFKTTDPIYAKLLLSRAREVPIKLKTIIIRNIQESILYQT